MNVRFLFRKNYVYILIEILEKTFLTFTYKLISVIHRFFPSSLLQTLKMNTGITILNKLKENQNHVLALKKVADESKIHLFILIYAHTLVKQNLTSSNYEYYVL